MRDLRRRWPSTFFTIIVVFAMATVIGCYYIWRPLYWALFAIGAIAWLIYMLKTSIRSDRMKHK